MMKITPKFLLPAILFSTSYALHAQTADTLQAPGINLSYMDTSVKPSDDFFRFVNGKWIDQTDIPDNKTRWGSFDELRVQTDEDVLAILKATAKNDSLEAGTEEWKVASLYKTIMDTVARNKQGILPIKPALDKIGKIYLTTDLQKFLTDMEPNGGVGFFSLNVHADAKDSNRNVIYISPTGLGLPDKDYYMSDDDDSKDIRKKYRKHIRKMLKKIGYNGRQAKQASKNIIKFETQLAGPMLSRVERRDSRNTYNPVSVIEMRGVCSSIEWNKYLTSVGIWKEDSLVVSDLKYMKALNRTLKKRKIYDWRDYLRWSLLNRSSDYLSTDIEDENWQFYGKTLKGAKKQEKREIRALHVVNATMGEALGKLYVAEKFPPEAKAKAEDMITNVKLAFENRINALPWMAPATRQNAIEKLNRLTVKVGYPDKWKDYSGISIKSPKEGGEYYENMMNVANWRHLEDLADLRKPVDKSEWHMSPQTVNAYFNPAYNEIVFPAAILQPPFYDYKADEAVNYGGIGAVIGHEISHGFDDSGSRYNADGNLVNWWSDADLEKFTGLGGALADQYSALQPLPGIYVDGKFTLGENIGDLGGVNAAYDGLQLYLKKHGNPGLIDGFTPEQRFFISWATIWRTKMRDEAIKNLVKTDPHSPGMFRAYVPLQNIDAFYRAFDIKEGDGMFVAPDKRVKIW